MVIVFFPVYPNYFEKSLTTPYPGNSMYFTPDGNYIYTVSGDNKELFKINTSDITIVDSIPDIGIIGSFHNSLVFTQSGDSFYLANYGKNNSILVIDTASNNIVSSIPVPWPLAVELSNDGRRLYVAGNDDSNIGYIKVINTGDLTISETIYLPDNDPVSIEYVSKVNRLYVACGFSHSIYAIDTAENRIVDTIENNHSGFISEYRKIYKSPDERYLINESNPNIVIFDTINHLVHSVITPEDGLSSSLGGDGFYDSDIAPDGKSLLVTLRYPKVAVFQTYDYTLIEVIDLLNPIPYPLLHDIRISPNGQRAFLGEGSNIHVLCVGDSEEGCIDPIDNDRDGFSFPEDCNDYVHNINPSVPETCSNDYDDDCDGLINETCNPILSITSDYLDFGSDETELTFEIQNIGAGTLSWSISENETWLGCTSSSGDTSGDGIYTGIDPETITVSVGRNGLAIGDYTGNITITSNGGNETIQVRMTVENVPVLTEISFVDIGSVYGINGNGSVICATDGNLRIIDVGDPDNATLKSTVDTPGSARSCAVINGSYAYVSDADYAITVVDISDIENPILLGSEVPEPIDSDAFTIDIYWPYAYVGSYTYYGLNTQHSYLQIIDINDPDNPSRISTIDLGKSWVPDIHINNNLLYLSRVENDVHWIYDLSNPTSPSPLANTNTGAESIFISETYAYKTNDYNNSSVGLMIDNVSDPYNPIQVSSIGTPTGALDVTVYGNFAYIADQQTGIQIVNVEDPSSPRTVSSVEMDANVESIFIDYPYLYVGSWDGLHVFEISGD